jgi:hypothetical protein
VLATNQIEQEGHHVGVGNNGSGRDFCPISESDCSRAASLGYDAHDAGTQAQAATPSTQAPQQGLRERARAALGYRITAGGRDHSQDEPQPRAEPIVGADIGVQCETRQHPACGEAGKPALGEIAPARQERCCQARQVARTQSGHRTGRGREGA